MQLVSWNVNSLRSSEPNFLEFVSTHQPDLLLVQELRADPDQLSFFLRLIPGYQAVFNPSGVSGYGGTALYYRTSLPLNQVSASTGNSVLDSEGRTILARLGNTYILNFYTPNGNRNQARLDYKLQFYGEIIKFTAALMQSGNSIIIGGDLNVGHTPLDLYAPQANSNHSGFLTSERAWFDRLLSLGFCDTFRLFETGGGHYTWWHMRDPKRQLNQGWRFDYFLVSSNITVKVKQSAILHEVYGSDHCPILLDIDL